MRIHLKSLQNILNLLFILAGFAVFGQSQTISKPTLVGYGTSYNNMCVRSTSDVYPITFTFPEKFPAENVFHIELSDANGEFENPVDLKTIQGKNEAYYIRESITMPKNTYGDKFRIRIRATHPEESSILSPPSAYFEAYYIDASTSIVLNNNEDVVLCNGEAKQISLSDTTKKYVWYKNGTVISNESEPTITVTEEGQYYAKPYYGDCSSSFSTAINVREFSTQAVSIKGENKVVICGGEEHTFEATIVDESTYNYEWFKDNVIIEGATSASYTTPTNNQFGVYEVVLTPKLDGSCVSKSQKVTLSQKQGNDFTVEIVGANELVVLPSGQVVLEVNHNASKGAIQWYKDGKPFSGAETAKIAVTNAGVYYAEVTDTSANCPFVKNSEEILVLAAKEFVPTVKANENYQPCESTETDVSLVGVKALATNDKEYSLTEAQVGSLTFAWYRNNTALADSNKQKIAIASYLEAGSYKLEVSDRDVLGTSNVLEIGLLAENFELASTSVSNVLCSNETITLSVSPIVEGFTYQWFKGEEPLENVTSKLDLSEIGLYSVIVSGFGCEKLLEADVKLFDDSVVKTTPSKVAVLPEGGSVEIIAEGADEYEWYNADGDLVASSPNYEAVKVGIYTLVAKVKTCSVTKEIKVVEDDGKIIIPNIISPYNADGINDKWELPNRFSFKPNVRVIIYSVAGKEIFNTKDYQNNWPENNNEIKDVFFYFRIFKEKSIIKSGTISVLE